MWEYFQISCFVNESPAKIEELSKEGWEMYGFSYDRDMKRDHFWLKRKLNRPEPPIDLPKALHHLCTCFDILNADRDQNIFVDPNTLELIKQLFAGPHSSTWKLSTDFMDKSCIRIQMDGFGIIFKTLSNDRTKA